MELTEHNPVGLVQEVLEAGAFQSAYSDLKRDPEQKHTHVGTMHEMVQDFEFDEYEPLFEDGESE